MPDKAAAVHGLQRIAENSIYMSHPEVILDRFCRSEFCRGQAFRENWIWNRYQGALRSFMHETQEMNNKGLRDAFGCFQDGTPKWHFDYVDSDKD